ncbi:hypothetical protein DL96DRAFT_1626320 [Flagelloscypha sp. PMI_526]|nr:hypothetical protein DL96DRAFT_1626320 [Flagelloscypha sp. PMI_526]
MLLKSSNPFFYLLGHLRFGFAWGVSGLWFPLNYIVALCVLLPHLAWRLLSLDLLHQHLLSFPNVGNGIVRLFQDLILVLWQPSLRAVFDAISLVTIIVGIGVQKYTQSSERNEMRKKPYQHHIQAPKPPKKFHIIFYERLMLLEGQDLLTILLLLILEIMFLQVTTVRTRMRIYIAPLVDAISAIFAIRYTLEFHVQLISPGIPYALEPSPAESMEFHFISNPSLIEERAQSSSYSLDTRANETTYEQPGRIRFPSSAQTIESSLPGGLYAPGLYPVPTSIDLADCNSIVDSYGIYFE